MLERSFDELLEEERAFALRHLAGRAEYERMRALLHHVREERPQPPGLEASPAVREHVLEAFRAQRQPQWRIWLNSVGAFLMPRRPVQYWRPALALGMVAVVAILGIDLLRSTDHGPNKILAEVRPPNAEPAVPSAPRAEQGTSAPYVTAPAAGTTSLNTNEAPAQATRSTALSAEAEDTPPAEAPPPMQQITTGTPDMAKAEAAPPVPQANTDADSRLMEMPAALAGTAAMHKEAREATTSKSTAALADASFSAGHPEDRLLGLLQAAW